MVELITWQQYVRKRGSLNVGRRIENHIGSFAYMYAGVNSKKAPKIADFMPHEAHNSYNEEDEALDDFERLRRKFGA